MRMFHPHTPTSQVALQTLLTTSLRPDGAPFPMVSEYPLVLGPGRELMSYCLGDDEIPVAHANLLPRRLLLAQDDKEIAVGLVGNVATLASHRGQGYMGSVLTELKRAATRQGLEALILWSDLLAFYQKSGFTSCGRERRWLFQGPWPQAKVGDWRVTSAADADCNALLQQRYHHRPTLARSATEFAALLTIPDVSCLTSKSQRAFTLMGKGCDMTGVVHEWGAPTPEILWQGIAAQATLHQYAEVVLLTPAVLPESWEQVLKQKAASSQIHPMALAWCPSVALRAQLEQSFVWGLDSI